MIGLEEPDVLLQRFLKERDPTIAQECLERLLSEHVEPLVRDIAGYKFRSSSGSFNSGNEVQDEEDVRSEVVLQLISRLRGLRSSDAQAPIENFRGYVAATTYNAYYKYVRMKYPARWRVKNRLRYLLSHDRNLAIWVDESEEYVCGLSGWRRNRDSRTTAVEKANIEVSTFVNSLAPGDVAAKMSLPELVNKLFGWWGRPILLDELVGVVAELLEVRDPKAAEWQSDFSEEGSGNSICELLPDPHVDIATSLEQRLYLERLWREVCQLPLRQRLALLLNLRDPSAGDALILFTLTGIVNLRRIAEALEIPPEELATLWNKLPLQDAEIATFLGITRQQVINLRKSARERLLRRMIAS